MLTSGSLSWDIQGRATSGLKRSGSRRRSRALTLAVWVRGTGKLGGIVTRLCVCGLFGGLSNPHKSEMVPRDRQPAVSWINQNRKTRKAEEDGQKQHLFFLLLVFFFFFFFFFFFLAAQRYMEFPGQGSDPSHSFDLHRSCGNAGSSWGCNRRPSALIPLHPSRNPKKQHHCRAHLSGCRS